MTLSPASRMAEAAWLEAMTQPTGIGVVVSDPARAKGQLYNARKRLAERGVDLSAFSLRTSPVNPAFELWIVRNATNDNPSEAHTDASSQPVQDA